MRGIGSTVRGVDKDEPVVGREFRVGTGRETVVGDGVAIRDCEGLTVGAGAEGRT